MGHRRVLGRSGCSLTRAALSGQYQRGHLAHIPATRPFEKLSCRRALACRLRSRPFRAAIRLYDGIRKWHLGPRLPKDQGFGGPSSSANTQAAAAIAATDAGPKRLAGISPTDRRVCGMCPRKPFFVQMCHFAVHIPLDTTDLNANTPPNHVCCILSSALRRIVELDTAWVECWRRSIGSRSPTTHWWCSRPTTAARARCRRPAGHAQSPLRGEKGSSTRRHSRTADRPRTLRSGGDDKCNAGNLCDLYLRCFTPPPCCCRTTNRAMDSISRALRKMTELPSRNASTGGTSIQQNPAKRAVLALSALSLQPPSGAVRIENLKLIEFLTPEVELYDLAKDLSRPSTWQFGIQWPNAAPSEWREVNGRCAATRRSILNAPANGGAGRLSNPLPRPARIGRPNGESNVAASLHSSKLFESLHRIRMA